MRAHGGVDAQGNERVFEHLAVNAFAHAMQSLQFIRRTLALSELRNRCNCGGVVGGKLRIDHIAIPEHGLRAGQIAHIGVVLVGEHGVSAKAHFLRALDLRIPIRAFHQAAHELHAMQARQASHFINQLYRAGLIRLQSQTQPLPLRMMHRHFCQKRIEHIERELQAIHLFRINREVHVGARSKLAELPHARHKLGHHAAGVTPLVARVQGRELDGDAIGGLRGVFKAF